VGETGQLMLSVEGGVRVSARTVERANHCAMCIPVVRALVSSELAPSRLSTVHCPLSTVDRSHDPPSFELRFCWDLEGLGAV
jgi:hypothetical protein